MFDFDGPERFFIDGKFKQYILEEEVSDEYDLIHIPQIGFYAFNDVWSIIDEESIRHYCKMLLENKYKSAYVNEVIKGLKDQFYVSINELNKNRNRIVLLNGTLDISDWCNPIFYEDKFFRDDYSTIQLKCNYNKDAKSIEFNKFLNSIFNKDEELINLISEIFGYCLTSNVKMESSFIFYGSGSNGKSVLIKILQKLLTNENVCSVNINELNKPFSRSSLFNKLVNICSELEDRITSTSYFKQIVSGDLVSAQFKYKDEFVFQPFCKMIFALNNLPIARDKSNGFYRRLIIVPFENTYKGNNKDIFLIDKLSSELDGVLQFALEGLKRLKINNEFTYSKKIEKLKKIYKESNNPIEIFIDEYIELSNDDCISCKDLYKKYQNFCTENGHKGIYNNANFGKEILEILPSATKNRMRIKDKREYVYQGVKLIY